VGDHEDATAVRMALGDPTQRVQDPLLVRLGRLADELDAVALDRGQAFPVSPVFLPQITIEHHRKPKASGDDLGCLASPGEIARVDRLQLLARKRVGEVSCLPAAEVGEGPVCVPLQAPVGVPVGLAVANEQERGHD